MLRQLAKDNEIQLEEDETVFAVMTRAKKMLTQAQVDNQLQKEGREEEETLKKQDETKQKDNPEEEDTLEKEDVEEETDGQGEIATEFQIEEDIFEQSNKPRTHKTRTERREHNLQWNKMLDINNMIQLKTEQEKDPKIQRWIQQDDPT